MSTSFSRTITDQTDKESMSKKLNFDCNSLSSQQSFTSSYAIGTPLSSHTERWASHKSKGSDNYSRTKNMEELSKYTKLKHIRTPRDLHKMLQKIDSDHSIKYSKQNEVDDKIYLTYQYQYLPHLKSEDQKTISPCKKVPPAVPPKPKLSKTVVFDNIQCMLQTNPQVDKSETVIPMNNTKPIQNVIDGKSSIELLIWRANMEDYYSKLQKSDTDLSLSLSSSSPLSRPCTLSSLPSVLENNGFSNTNTPFSYEELEQNLDFEIVQLFKELVICCPRAKLLELIFVRPYGSKSKEEYLQEMKEFNNLILPDQFMYKERTNQQNLSLQKRYQKQSIQHIREEMFCKIMEKLSINREKETILEVEKRECKDKSFHLVSSFASSSTIYEVDKLKLHLEEMNIITSLVLSLAGRMAKTENELLNMDWNGIDERYDLEMKRSKLAEQLQEVQLLKTKLDRREATVAGYVRNYLGMDQAEVFKDLITKSMRIIVGRKDNEEKRIQCETQLNALNKL